MLRDTEMNDTLIRELDEHELDQASGGIAFAVGYGLLLYWVITGKPPLQF